MWATRLRCPSCPQRIWMLMPLSFDEAVASPTGCMTNDGPYAWRRLQGRQHAGEDFEPQVFFVAQPVCAELERPDLVVEPIDEAERGLVLGPTVGRNAVPVTVDHGGELLIRLEPLPLEAPAPGFPKKAGP